jgi:hypothetical protein
LDLEIIGCHLYRRGQGEAGEIHLTAGNPLRADESGQFTFVDREVSPGGRYVYRFAGILASGPVIDLGTESGTFSPPAPAMLTLSPPRPSPFRAQVSWRYAIPRPGPVVLGVHDLLGRRVRTLRDGITRPGVYDAFWDGRTSSGRPTSSGVYYVILRHGGETRVRPVVRIR